MAKIVIADSDFAVSDIEQKMIEDAGIEFARFQDKSAAQNSMKGGMCLVTRPKWCPITPSR